MKRKRINKLSGLIASVLLTVSICSAPVAAEALTVRRQSPRKTVTQKETAGQNAVTSARASGRSVSFQVRSGTAAVNVPTVSREKVLTGAQLKITTSRTVIRKTGSSPATAVIGGQKAAVKSSSTRVTANTSKDRGTSMPAVKTGEQPTISNTDGSDLCLVGLGLQLNPDGSMKQELIGRLEMLKIAAEKNPHAIIVCTGGHTAENNLTVSEAGQMAKWLRKNGIDPDRILVEPHSLSTRDNAIYTLNLLKKSHPEISRIAIITSDYHMNDGVRLFTTQANQMGSHITVTAGNTWRTR